MKNVSTIIQLGGLTKFGYLQGAIRGMERLMKEKRNGKETDGLVMFESMMQKAEKSNIVLDPERMASNGGIMLFAGMWSTMW